MRGSSPAPATDGRKPGVKDGDTPPKLLQGREAKPFSPLSSKLWWYDLWRGPWPRGAKDRYPDGPKPSMGFGRAQRNRAWSCQGCARGRAALDKEEMDLRIPTNLLTLLSAVFITTSPVFVSSVQSAEICGAGRRVNCVVDGDTFWMNRVKYRIYDIDAPEAGQGAQCPKERDLAERSTRYLAQLLEGRIEIVEHGKDRYGRFLVSVTAEGVAVGPAIITAGLARAYTGGRRDMMLWCSM